MLTNVLIVLATNARRTHTLCGLPRRKMRRNHMHESRTNTATAKAVREAHNTNPGAITGVNRALCDTRTAALFQTIESSRVSRHQGRCQCRAAGRRLEATQPAIIPVVHGVGTRTRTAGLRMTRSRSLAWFTQPAENRNKTEIKWRKQVCTEKTRACRCRKMP